MISILNEILRELRGIRAEQRKINKALHDIGVGLVTGMSEQSELSSELRKGMLASRNWRMLSAIDSDE
jgi:hypothetical protein